MPAISRQPSPNLLRASAFALVAAMGAPVAQAADVVINGTTETSPPYSMSPTDDLLVGTTGTGVLNVVGGTFITNSTILGDTATGNGTVNVTDGGFGGPTSNFTIGNAGSGTFFGQSSVGIFIYSAVTTIGTQSGSNGDATLSGAGAFWTVTGSFNVGASGTGTLTVDDGAELTTYSVVTVGDNAGSSGIVNIDSATWNASADTYIANDGTGIVNLTNGATFDAGNNSLYIGAADGTGTFNVSSGSSATTGAVYIGYCGGGCSSSIGIANISGSGTTWDSGAIYVGYEDSEGTLNVSDGAVVTTTGDISAGYLSNQRFGVDRVERLRRIHRRLCSRRPDGQWRRRVSGR